MLAHRHTPAAFAVLALLGCLSAPEALEESVLLRGSPVGARVLVPLTRHTTRQSTREGAPRPERYTYSGNITLGSERPQEFSVVFDTASGQVVVPEASCQSPACLQRKRYHIEVSPSAHRIAVSTDGKPPGLMQDRAEVSWSVADDFVASADDNWSFWGNFVSETVCVGGSGGSAGGPRGLCREVNLLVARNMSDDPFTSLAFDGIFGLGLDGLSATPAFNFAGALLHSSLGVAQFGIYISKGDGTDGGELAMAGYNAARMKGPLSWTPVASPEMGFWQVRIRAVRIGDRVLDACRGGDCRGILDSGCSQLGVPMQQMSEFLHGLAGPGEDVTDCRLAEAPTLTLELEEGVSLTLGAQDLMRQDASPDARLRLNGEKPKLCKPKVVPVSMGAPFAQSLFVLGEPVLRRYYTAFEWRNEASRVGFALANHGHEEMDNDVIFLLQVRMV